MSRNLLQDFDGDPRRQPPTCDRCGVENLEWVDIGMGRWRLYESDSNNPHTCKRVNPAEADEFETL